MSLIDLFEGIAVVIDDQIDNPDENINKIIAQFESKSIPLLKYDKLPDDDSLVKNLRELSFLLLDWRLTEGNPLTEGLTHGVKMPSELKEFDASENIAFLKKLKDVCFCPIFIFTNESVESVVSKLEDADLYDKNSLNHILIRQKVNVADGTNLFNEVERWVFDNPSIYVLKEWEREYRKSKNKLFSDFQKLSPRWPKIMWDTFGEDNVNQSLELGELISRNLHTRMTPFEFENNIFDTDIGAVDPIELKRVIQGEKYLNNTNLHSDNLAPGDLFKKSGKYYLNIRAGCDLIPRHSNPDLSLDDVKIYLIRGSHLSSEKEKDMFKSDYGAFSELDCQSVVFPLDELRSIDFRFKELEINKWGDWKKFRIGRLLPPHINRIQQKYGLYIQRQALPRIPTDAF